MGYNSGALKLLSSVSGIVGAAGSIPTLVETLSKQEIELLAGTHTNWRFERVPEGTVNEDGEYPINLKGHKGRFGYCWGNKNGIPNLDCKEGGVYWGKRVDRSKMNGTYGLVLMFGDGVKNRTWADFIAGKENEKVKKHQGNLNGEQENWKKEYEGGGNVGGIFCLVNYKNGDRSGYGFLNLEWEEDKWLCRGRNGDKIVPIVDASWMYSQTTGGSNKREDLYCVWQAGVPKNGTTERGSSNTDSEKHRGGRHEDIDWGEGICITTPSQWAWVRKD